MRKVEDKKEAVRLSGLSSVLYDIATEHFARQAPPSDALKRKFTNARLTAGLADI